MRVEEVHFNHAPGSSGGALTICRNGTSGAIVAPEWKRTPAVREPASYARDAMAGPAMIKVKFSGGPPNAIVHIRALDEVAPTRVTFSSSGVSSLVSMRLTRPMSAIGKRVSPWRWQREMHGLWTDFDQTEHTIYIVLGMPALPWVQSGDETQLPWADALDVACDWASGANTIDAAAERITHGVNRVPNVSYSPATMFSNGVFYLSSYLSALNGPGEFKMNCTDCADAVATLANLLGCSLLEGRFLNIKQTKVFLTLSGNPAKEEDWVTTSGWAYHEIAWLDNDRRDTVWDGCLQLDMSNTPDTHVAKLPAKMRFQGGPDDYRERLVASGDGKLGFTARRSVA